MPQVLLGKNGRGNTGIFPIWKEKWILLPSTFSKAVGGVGGFIATNKELVSLFKLLFQDIYVFHCNDPPGYSFNYRSTECN